jgi:release factor glutamine methyltransferase
MIGDRRLEIAEHSIGETISYLKSLFSKFSNTPSQDAQVLLAHICGQNRAWILAHPEAFLTITQMSELDAAVSRLETGEPFPYVLGQWSFYGLDFTINPDTLIPRPETELMVEKALEWLEAHPEKRTAADIGTGSGCIAIALAVNIPDLQITATDISSGALEIAQTNAHKHNVINQVNFIQSDLLLLPTPHTPFQLICANLPYIPNRMLVGLEVYGREPTLALEGGSDGLELIRRLLPQALCNLSSGGLLLLEIEASQGKDAINLAHETFHRARIEMFTDLAGLDRLIMIETFAE